MPSENNRIRLHLEFMRGEGYIRPVYVYDKEKGKEDVLEGNIR